MVNEENGLGMVLGHLSVPSFNPASGMRQEAYEMTYFLDSTGKAWSLDRLNNTISPTPIILPEGGDSDGK